MKTCYRLGRLLNQEFKVLDDKTVPMIASRLRERMGTSDEN